MVAGNRGGIGSDKADESGALLGAAIRARRRELGLTLVQLASESDLSHPFLSQVERGQARPSMLSLYRIATALGTTQQTLLARGVAPASSSGIGTVGKPDNDHGVSSARLIDGVENGAFITELIVTSSDFGPFYRHAHREMVYVVAGAIEVELASGPGANEFHNLRARDSLAYPREAGHRFRCAGTDPAVVLLVHSPHGH